MEETRPADTRQMLRDVLDHPHFVRVWEDRENVDRYLFVNGTDSYSAHGLVAAHEWVVNHPFPWPFPQAPMIERLRERERSRPTPVRSIHTDVATQERLKLIKDNHPFPWEGPDE